MIIETPGGILDKLYAYAKEKPDFDLESTLDEILQIIPYGRPDTLERELDRDVHGHKIGKHKEASAKRGFYHWVLFLHLLYKIDLEKLGLDPASLFYKKLKEIEQRRSSSVTLELKQFEGNELERQSKMSEYGKVVEAFLSKMNLKLLIYDYLERHQYELEDEGHMYTKKDAYMKVHDDIFVGIEERFSQQMDRGSPIKYKRYLALPLRHKYISDDPALVTDDDLKREVIRCSSLPLFKHMCRCVKKYPTFADKIESSGFYMVKVPTRTYHYAVIDNGSHFMVEYYRYNSFRVCKPDILHVGENTVAHKGRIDTYMREFEKLRGKEHKKFDLEGVPQILESLIENTKSEIATLSAKTSNQIKVNKESLLKLLGKKLDFIQKLERANIQF